MSALRLVCFIVSRNDDLILYVLLFRNAYQFGFKKMLFFGALRSKLKLSLYSFNRGRSPACKAKKKDGEESKALPKFICLNRQFFLCTKMSNIQ